MCHLMLHAVQAAGGHSRLRHTVTVSYLMLHHAVTVRLSTASTTFVVAIADVRDIFWVVVFLAILVFVVAAVAGPAGGGGDRVVIGW